MSADREVVELLAELSAIDSANPSLLKLADPWGARTDLPSTVACTRVLTATAIEFCR